MRKGRGEITKLSALFEKYRSTLRAPQSSVIDCFCDVVEDLVGVPVSKASVSYAVHSKTLALRLSGPLKSEIQLRKGEILSHMKGRLGEQNAPAEII
jgi:hypothetical protein